jgi:MFS family permease
MWVAATVLFGHGHLTRVAPGGLIDLLVREYDVNAAALGNLTSMYWYGYAAALIPGGILLDRYPTGRVITLTGLLCVLGGVIFALAPDLLTANIGRLVSGVGGAALFSACIKLARDWFAPARFSLLGGVVVLFGMVGGAIGQAPLAWLAQLAGWQTVMFWIAIAALPLSLLLWFTPSQAATARTAEAAEPMDFRTVWRMLGRTVRAPQVWIATAMALAIGTPAISFALWTVGYYMQVHNHERASAALFTSIALLGWAGGSLLVGWISGRIGQRKPPAIACAAISLIGWSLFVAVPDLPELAHFVLMFVLGLAAGGIVVSFALVAEHGPARGIGMSTGLANTVVMVASALVLILMGLVLDWHWEGTMLDGVRVYPVDGYRKAFIIMPLVCVVGVVAALLVRETHCQPRGD